MQTSESGGGRYTPYPIRTGRTAGSPDRIPQKSDELGSDLIQLHIRSPEGAVFGYSGDMSDMRTDVLRGNFGLRSDIFRIFGA